MPTLSFVRVRANLTRKPGKVYLEWSSDILIILRVARQNRLFPEENDGAYKQDYDFVDQGFI